MMRSQGARRTATFVAMRVHEDCAHRATQDSYHSVGFQRGLMNLELRQGAQGDRPMSVDIP
ncbi:hypothetical protein [Candidatus Regiella insecticola]|uniref:hypothetical protein n=1 Tax=Candidatus Regiella insecticola TaxID=138073 RepID=UPI00159E5396